MLQAGCNSMEYDEMLVLFLCLSYLVILGISNIDLFDEQISLK